MHKIACRLTRILQVRISLHQEPRNSEFVLTRKNVLLVVRFEGYVLVWELLLDVLFYVSSPAISIRHQGTFFGGRMGLGWSTSHITRQ